MDKRKQTIIWLLAILLLPLVCEAKDYKARANLIENNCGTSHTPAFSTTMTLFPYADDNYLLAISTGLVASKKVGSKLLFDFAAEDIFHSIELSMNENDTFEALYTIYMFDLKTGWCYVRWFLNSVEDKP